MRKAEKKQESTNKRINKEREQQRRARVAELDEKVEQAVTPQSLLIPSGNTVADVSIAKRMKKKAKETSHTERFLTWRMWADTLFSLFRADRGIIPKDIGDRIYIGNNVYVTQNSMTAIVQINEFSSKMPMAFASELINEVKDRVPECFVDIQFKNQLFDPDFTDRDGFAERKRSWTAVIDKGDEAPQKERERAVRLLYSYDILQTGIRAYQTMCFVHLRSNNASTTKRAVKACQGFLRSCDCDNIQLKTKLPLLIPYLLETSIKHSKIVSNIPRSITTSATLAQSLPVTQGINADHGMLMGIDNSNGSPYWKDFRESQKARAVYVSGYSGSGKTYLVTNWVLNGHMDMYGASIQDIKGNDYSSLVKACGGMVISMRPGNTCFINKFKMRPKDIELKGETFSEYFDNNIAYCKELLTIIAAPQPEYRVEVSGFIDEFLHHMYLQLGVERSNPNTWKRSEVLTVDRVYKFFKNFLSADVKSVYASIIKPLQMSYAEFLSPNGSESHVFEKEYDVRECLESDIISFDYGMLGNSRNANPVSFALRNLFMEAINDDFIYHRWMKGLWTLCVLEESQFIDSFSKRQYTKTLTLRRAQNCVVFLLGNSAQAIANDPETKAMFANITMCCIGSVTKSDRRILVEEFGLDAYAEILDKIATQLEYEYRFLFVDRTTKSTAALLSVEVPKSVRNGPIFKSTEE